VGLKPYFNEQLASISALTWLVGSSNDPGTIDVSSGTLR